jgi:hypothetical protein
MRGVTHVVLVLVVLWNCHDFRLAPAGASNLRCDLAVSLFKIDHMPPLEACLFLLLLAVGLRLLLLLGNVLAWLRCLVDQRGGLAVFLALGNQSEPRAGHVEKGAFAFGIADLLSKLNTLSRVRSIFPSARHTHTHRHVKRPTPVKKRLQTRFVPAIQKGHPIDMTMERGQYP